MRIYSLAVAAGACLLSGCSSWPPPGQGGMAEFKAPTRVTIGEAEDKSPATKARVEHLRARIACESERQHQIEAEAAHQGILTGRVEDLSEIQNLALREFSQGLLTDAEATLARADTMTQDLAVTLLSRGNKLAECSR